MSEANACPPVFLLGATASGKTAVAIELVKSLSVEIISVDSALIYRQMDIGTAKPDSQELAAAPHRLINIVDPWESYSVSRFIDDAKRHISEIQNKGNIPLLVGGTMMYYKALESGLSDMPSASPELRDELELRAASIGWQAMHDELQKIDPDSAARIHPNDPQRIQRALEVWYSSGKTMTQWHAQDLAPAMKALKFGLFPEKREVLHQRIADRYRLMLESGFVEEVEQLRALPGMTAELPSMRCVGYRQVWQYLEGEDNYETMVDKGLAATRQLAKRQITWMRSMHQLTLFDSCDMPLQDIANEISTVIESL